MRDVTIELKSDKELVSDTWKKSKKSEKETGFRFP